MPQLFARSWRRATSFAFASPAVPEKRGRRQTGVKEHYGVGRIEHGDTEWWGRGKVWRSVAGCVLVKQPGDVVRHLAAEAISALAVAVGARPDYSRPVRLALEYIRARFGDSITLDDLARHAELDKFHLCRAFRAQIGMPPHAYLTHLRIARAKELLRGGVRASDLAPLVGVYDQAQLTRHFRKLVGTTPARYAKSPQHPKYRGVVSASARQ